LGRVQVNVRLTNQIATYRIPKVLMIECLKRFGERTILIGPFILRYYNSKVHLDTTRDGVSSDYIVRVS